MLGELCEGGSSFWGRGGGLCRGVVLGRGFCVGEGRGSVLRRGFCVGELCWGGGSVLGSCVREGVLC